MSKVMIAGSINMDIVATSVRHPMPGETIKGRDIHFFPGGKGANQAVASSRLGARTLMIGKVGPDAFGDQMELFLREEHIDLTCLRRTPSMATGTAMIVVAENGENTIVVIPGANGELKPEEVAETPIEGGDILVSQFEIPMNSILAFFEKGRKLGAKTILNAAPAQPCPPQLLSIVDVLIVNETELSLLSQKTSIVDEVSIVAAARGLRSTPRQIVVVTLGAEGAIAITEDHEIRIPGRKVQAVDATGAGDCFVGALASRLSSCTGFEESLLFANVAASICVQRLGAGSSMPNYNEVEEILSKHLYETTKR